MSRLSNRVTALEADTNTDTDFEQVWTVAGVQSMLFGQALRDHASGNLNAFEEMRQKMPELPNIEFSKAEQARIASEAAEFRRRIEAIRRNMQ